MRRELYRSRTDPSKRHPARLGRKKVAPKSTPTSKAATKTFINISQEQKHGRGPRR